MSIKVSIAIPTKGRSSEIIETVRSLIQQSVEPFEIIIVDQNDPPLFELDEYLKTIKNLKHVRNHQPGLVRNYNECLKQARGDVVLFLDDDITANPDLVKNIIKAFESDEKLGAVAGRVENRVGDLPPTEIKKVGHYNPWTNAVTANFNAEGNVRPVMFAQGAQMAFRRAALETIKGFDEGFVGNGYFFETDGGLRLLKQGYEIEFHPECKIMHHMAPRGGARINKLDHTYYFVRNGVRLHLRHAAIYQYPVFYVWLLGYILLKSAYNLSPKLLLKSLKALIDGLYFRPL